MNAQEMFKSIGWKKVKNPEELKPIFDDYYLNNAVVYEYYRNLELRCRLYFIDKVYGYAIDNRTAVEVPIKEHQAITQQMKELGWL
jgi:hypothetical protein